MPSYQDARNYIQHLKRQLSLPLSQLAIYALLKICRQSLFLTQEKSMSERVTTDRFLVMHIQQAMLMKDSTIFLNARCSFLHPNKKACTFLEHLKNFYFLNDLLSQAHLKKHVLIKQYRYLNLCYEIYLSYFSFLFFSKRAFEPVTKGRSKNQSSSNALQMCMSSN